jgi:sulfite exporter TauE/SafE
MGFAMSVGHCAGMCGPLVAAFGMSRGAESGSRVRLAADVLAYHFGRLLSYAALGALLGMGGAGLRAAFPSFDLRPGLSVFAGLALVVPAIVLLATAAPGEAGAWAAPVRALLGVASRAAAPLRRLGPIGLGVGNGLLPCGPVALVAMGAASAPDPARAALSLVIFGLGTVPVLVALTLGAATLRLRPRPWLARTGSVLLLLLATQLSLRGLAAMGRLPHLEVGSWPLW